jgi:hypothetical protein
MLRPLMLAALLSSFGQSARAATLGPPRPKGRTDALIAPSASEGPDKISMALRRYTQMTTAPMVTALIRGRKPDEGDERYETDCQREGEISPKSVAPPRSRVGVFGKRVRIWNGHRHPQNGSCGKVPGGLAARPPLASPHWPPRATACAPSAAKPMVTYPPGRCTGWHGRSDHPAIKLLRAGERHCFLLLNVTVEFVVAPPLHDCVGCQRRRLSAREE